MSRALITGGCGFIASNLVNRLVNDGVEVDVVDDLSSGDYENLDGLDLRIVPMDLLALFQDHEKSWKRPAGKVVVFEGDFADERILDRVNRGVYDDIYHLAAVPRVAFSVEHPALTTEINLNRSVLLLEAARGAVGRVVVASSSSVYGGAGVLPTSETHPRDPKSPYALQKSCLEDFCRVFSRLYGLDTICLRFFNVFGPNQRQGGAYATAVSSWCHAIKNDLPLRSDGDGTQSRDLCYVDNVVDALILAANSDKRFLGDAYNVCCGDRTSNNEILERLRQLYPHINVQSAPWRAGDVMHTQGDWSAAQRDLGYEPKVRFWEGLAKTLDWWKL